MSQLSAPSRPIPFGTLEGMTQRRCRLRSKTALELAAGKRSLYPKQMLHLLTTSYHKPSESRLLNEVDIIAMANPKARLSGKIQSTPPRVPTGPLLVQQLGSMRSGGAIPPPHHKGYLPMITRQNACDTPLCDTISKGYFEGV